MRRFMLLAVPVFGLLVMCGAALVLTDRVALVETNGVSMLPSYEKGDLALVVKRSTYEVGNVAAYRNNRGLVVLHRIVGGDQKAWSFKGDNNGSIDVERPGANQLMGRVLLHVPRGGTWFHRLSEPVPLGAFLLLLLGGGSRARLTRGRRRRQAMARHQARNSDRWSLAPLSPPWTGVAQTCLALMIAGAGLAAAAWAAPATVLTATKHSATSYMTFSYAASVKPSAAYDGSTAKSPSPIFRRVTDGVVILRLDYRGRPGRLAVEADLATADGWQSTVQLATPRPVPADEYTVDVPLELGSLGARATAAAAAIGLPVGNLDITVRATVNDSDGFVFVPTLKLSLTPLKLSLAGAASTLNVTDISTSAGSARTPRVMTLGPVRLLSMTGRYISFALLGLGLVGLTLVFLWPGRRSLDEGSRIRRAHAQLLLRVHPIAAPPGSRCIDVADFRTLVRLADRYGLLILHWSRSGTETFIVQDEATSYRYRTAVGDCPSASATLRSTDCQASGAGPSS